ncbi:tRNA threonylcarbamoyladenosine biosynthesis protein TsaB [Dyadobacter sp. CECT 9275]|uniref:tRNA threonylcarbamoyladenosine biosynthesis protein TsaB n=1 Tax=Dyadobacter helix TaxID=2822344 RepID=A0A916JG17_9BACT|nr:tRNA (adenosine(37)-N6)-threonylcarbamoyltransferase complex dimerization subunit type 1 TsaB [Dyadobacter sp. CECT 9275]CAG5010588.1 tRNA threonylcarbamoyladenosine biosynthesis protein TsaB [Dyadobacter sp. CECT 9275]
MLILSIDTSTRGCSVALHRNAELLAGYDLYTERSSSAMLTTLAENVVKDSGFFLSDLDAIAVAKGPGSYTGLRVGVSTAKGLCYGLNKPMLAVNTLEAMYLQTKGFFPETTLFCPMIDARRMEVYAAVFDFHGNLIHPTEAIILTENSFDTELESNKVVFFGDGAAKCQPLFGNRGNAVFPSEDIKPSAKTVGILASLAFQNQQFENVASFEPYYLKDFMAPSPRKSVFSN